MVKKLSVILVSVITVCLSCTPPVHTGGADSGADGPYDLTTVEGFERALADEEYMKSLEPTFAEAGAAEDFMYGDVNGDGVVDITDAFLTARFYVGHADAGFIHADAADVDDDGLIDIVDALLIARYYVDLIGSFPAESNLFLNGHFHAGDKYWEYFEQEGGSGSMEVVNGELKVAVDNGGSYLWSIGVAQLGFNLQAGNSYTFTCRARTNSPGQTELRAVFQLQEEPWTSYGAQNWILTQEMTEYSFTFTMPVTDSAVGFNFHMGAPNSGDIFIDDVGLYDMDPQTPVSDNMLQNGDFSNGTEAWDLYANDPGIASMSVVNGELVVDISNAADGMWDIGVLQAGLHIKNSGRYTFSFKARAESVKTIWTSIQKPVDPWTGYSDLEVINLTTDMQQYTFDFTMLNITDDTAQIVFHIGADDIDLYLDDVTLYKVASPAVSMPTPLFRGINLSNTFDAPYEGAWGEGALMQEAYFQVIKDADFDHIRIPVRWSAHAEETAPYTIDPEFFDRIDWAIDNTISRGMTAVIDMHHYEEFNADPESQRERFIALWGQIAEHYKGYPDNLYFELYNEPGLSALFTVEFWNDAVKDVYNLIRTTNPTRYIVIGTVQWKDEREGSVQLELPDNYTNIILTFHPYIPWDFCFQQVEWMENPPPASEWNGTLEQREHIIEFLNIYTQWRAVHSDVPLWNGEFCVHMADMDSRVRWNTFISRECEKRGIAHTYWGFMNDEPALYDTTAGEWEKVDILHALLPEE